MDSDFADRMGSVHKSFIREILKVTQDPSIISFGGGLPEPGIVPDPGNIAGGGGGAAGERQGRTAVQHDRRLPAAAGDHRGALCPPGPESLVRTTS